MDTKPKVQALEALSTARKMLSAFVRHGNPLAPREGHARPCERRMPEMRNPSAKANAIRSPVTMVRPPPRARSFRRPPRSPHGPHRDAYPALNVFGSE